MGAHREVKQVIVIRSDLKMGKGKMVAQGCHASLMSYFAAKKRSNEIASEWVDSGEKKVVLKIDGKEALIGLYNRVKAEKIPTAIVVDAGLTEVPPGTMTALGIGPWEEGEIDRVTGTLTLL